MARTVVDGEHRTSTAGAGLATTGLALSALAAADAARELVTQGGFLPLPAVLLPLLSLAALIVGVLALRRTTSLWRGVAVLGTSLASVALAVVVLLLVVVLLYRF